MNRQWHTRIGIVVVAAGLTLSGCATLMSSNQGDVVVTSQPSALCVTIDGQPYGAAPVVAPLSRGHVHVVKVEQEGYLPYEMQVVPVVNPWTWGNLLFGGFLGLAIDGLTGALYEHSLTNIHAFFPLPIDRPRPATTSACPISPVVLEARHQKEREAEQRKKEAQALAMRGSH